MPVLLPEALLVLFLLSASINGTTCGIGEIGAGTAMKSSALWHTVDETCLTFAASKVHSFNGFPLLEKRRLARR